MTNPRADAIVVLGGATRPPLPPRPLPEVQEEGDRLIYAAELYRQGAAPAVLVSGGRIAFLRGGDDVDTEAADMAALLIRLGVPAEAIWQEARSQNTYENGLFSGEILAERGLKRIILVTSAYHMPRAAAIFEKQGLAVSPAPADFYVTRASRDRDQESRPLTARLYYLLPQAEYLEITTTALKEYIGIAVYRMRGWL